MDSFTQIALGAAVGEAVLGRKIGNRAMLWGAVGGTIPDLDIVANLFTDEMTALAFHRGISHSIFFAFVAAPILGFLVQRLYDSGLYQKRVYKIGVMLALLSLIMVLNFIPVMVGGSFNFNFLALTVFLSSLVAWRMWRSYINVTLEEVETSWRDWSLLFFWAVVTHPILDCFTAYGTQLFQPFSDVRIAFNIISVVDPIYTIPLIIGLIAASRLALKNTLRRSINYAGLVISSLYLMFCLSHKVRVDRVFADSFKKQGVEYSRFMTAPTIFNNILWQGIAESNGAYYHGFYSLWDKEPVITQINKHDKNHGLLEGYEKDRSVKILSWFTNNYFNVRRRQDGSLQINDLRYGTFSDGQGQSDNYIFKFILKDKNGRLEASQARDFDQAEGSFRELWERIKGI